VGRPVVDLALNLLRVPWLPLWWVLRKLTMPRESWVQVVIRRRVVEVDRPVHTLARFLSGMAGWRPTSLTALRELVAQIGQDRRIEGVIFEVPALHAGWSTADALRTLLLALRERGKRVVAWLPEGGGNRELFIATAADLVLTTPQATLAPLGVAASSCYVKGLLDRLGVQVEVHRRAEFKTAAEPAVHESMSDAQREQIGAVLDTIDAALVAALASRPRLGATPEARQDRVRTLFNDAMLSGKAALEAGLVDGLCYEDGLAQAIAGAGAKPPKIVPASRYHRFHAARFFRPIGPRPYVAIVPVHGAITQRATGLAPGGSTVSSEAVVAALRSVARDPRAVGVVLHVDSPGGSALASDLIHREVELLCDKKPVVACFGEVATSGGYYVAAPAHVIVAPPLAITGSIGVVAARLVARDLLEGLGIRTEVVRRAPHADLLANPRPMDADEHAIVEREIDGFYRAFVRVVARGRKRAEVEIEPLARGRIWSGRDAQARGLVDVLGGLDVALEQVRARLPFVPSWLRSVVETRVVWPRRPGDAPPIPVAAASMFAQAAATLDPGIADLVGLVAGGDRMLYYAVGLPRID
jgi:protease-4